MNYGRNRLGWARYSFACAVLDTKSGSPSRSLEISLISIKITTMTGPNEAQAATCSIHLPAQATGHKPVNGTSDSNKTSTVATSQR